MTQLLGSLHQRSDVAFTIRYVDHAGLWQRARLLGHAFMAFNPPHALLDAAALSVRIPHSRAHIQASTTPNGFRSGVTA